MNSSQASVERFARLYMAGLPMKEIAKRFGVRPGGPLYLCYRRAMAQKLITPRREMKGAEFCECGKLKARKQDEGCDDCRKKYKRWTAEKAQRTSGL